MKKKIIALVIAVAALSSALTVFAASGLQQISAYLNQDITINYNGEEQLMYNENGVQVFPITYNGTTYVPVRAISNIFGVDVFWDSDNNAVNLGAAERQPVSLFKLNGLTTTKYSWIINDAEDLVYNGTSGKTNYDNGLVFDIWNGSASVAESRLVWLPTDGKYTTVSFTATVSGCNATARIYDQNMNVITSFDLADGEIVTKEVNISGATSIAFGADAAAAATYGTLRVFNAVAQ